MLKTEKSETNPTTKEVWHKHPILVMLIGGLILWAIQFSITYITDSNKKSTEHYQKIMEHKITAYYELQTLSNRVFNQIRLLNKLILFDKKQFNTPFDLKKRIGLQCVNYLNARQEFVNRHYELYMLQSTEAKGSYEQFIQYTSDEIRSVELTSFPTFCLGHSPDSVVLYDADIPENIGSKEFILEARNLWVKYVKTLADELKFFKIDLDIRSLNIIDEEND